MTNNIYYNNRTYTLAEYEYNEVYTKYDNNNSLRQVIYGSAHAGKSYHVVRDKFLKFLTIPGFNVIMGRKTLKAAKDSIRALLRGFIQEYAAPYGIVVTENKSESTFFNENNKNTIYLIGAQHDEDAERLKGITCQSGIIECILLDEATQFTEDQMSKISTRLRGKSTVKNYLPGHVKHMTMIFNPVDVRHWIKKYFKIDTDANGNPYSHDPEVFVMRTTYKDNAYLEDEDLKSINYFKENNPLYYDVYGLGKWGNISQENIVIPYNIIHESLRDNPPGLIDIGAGERFDIGIDVAGTGKDQTVIMIKQGMKVLEIMAAGKTTAITITEAVKRLIDKHRGRNYEAEVHIKIDVTGEGAGTVDMLSKERMKNVFIYGIVFGGTKGLMFPDRYANIATEMYHLAAEMIPNMELLPDAEKTYIQLSNRRYSINWKKDSKTIIESKDEYKAKHHESPDFSDAFVLMCYPTLNKGGRVELIESDYKTNISNIINSGFRTGFM